MGNPNFTSISGNFFRFNIYIILGISVVLLILIQPYNGFCRSTKKCNPIMLESLMPTELGERKLVIKFLKPQNKDLEISLVRNKIYALTGTKIKNEVYLKNIGTEDHEIILSYNLKKFPKEFIKKLDCPCLSKRNIKAGEKQKITLHFFIKKEFEAEFDSNTVEIDLTATSIFSEKHTL